MIFLQAAPGSNGNFIFEVLFIVIIVVIIIWRIYVAVDGKKANLHPLKKDFYKKLLADYYLWRSDSLSGKRPTPKDIWEKQLNYLTKSIAVYPRAKVYTERAHNYLRINKNQDLSEKEQEENFNKAIQDLENALFLEPENPTIILQYTHKFLWTKYSGHFAAFGDLSDNDKKELQQLADKATRLLGQDHLMDKKHRIDTQNIYEFRAYILLKQYRLKEAIKDCDAALKMGIQHRARRIKIISLIYQGNFEEALKEYQDAMTVNPHYFGESPLLSSIKKLASLSVEARVIMPELTSENIRYFELQNLSDEIRRGNSAIVQIEQMFSDPKCGFNIEAY